MFSCALYIPTAPPHTPTLSLHDALPISASSPVICELTVTYSFNTFLISSSLALASIACDDDIKKWLNEYVDRKSTRLNSSHQIISSAALCLKKERRPWSARLRSSSATPL